MIPLPVWYGKAYPSLDNLVEYVDTLGVCVQFDSKIDVAVYFNEKDPIILIPTQFGLLDTIWKLAHETGHLCERITAAAWKRAWVRCENQANRWAACALLPEAEIQKASIDTFIAALSAHYEELPLHDCPARALAHRIATIRMDTISAK